VKHVFLQLSLGRSRQVGHCGNIREPLFASMTPPLSIPRIVIYVSGMQTGGGGVLALLRTGIERVRGGSC
jgi:hypothetical protein